MEMQIQDLVSAIKKEGVEAANLEAEKIIGDAKKKAEDIILKAKGEADDILKRAEREIETMKKSAETSVEHSKRDAMLYFKKAMTDELFKILEEDISRTVKAQTLSSLILAALNGEDAAKYSLEVAEVTDGLKSELAEKIKAGLEIRPNPNVRVGFRLIQRDGSGYFDFSDEELEKLLVPFFPEIAF